MTRDDLEVLRIPLIVLAITIVIAGAVVYSSSAILQSARHLLTQRESELRQARLRIQNAGEEKDMIGRYLNGFQQLARGGLVGDEQRINWLDNIRAANETAGVFGVEYEIGIQRPYVYASEFNAGQLLLQESLMQLKFRLLHEEDLPRFLTTLARRGGGFFTVDQCMLRRVKTEGERTLQFQPNLAAECDLRWITIKPPAAERKG
jgi:hypothetical protein